ncbi:hypothetical protein E2562_010559 [Oryza meyeriana var. granulata]|uniref:Uncharacterized protein n=1 Tax=Oryza meyeriana var. granulata TaxID=110450 RepID=A0A6G1BT99_9ORYZ|nr:hypothetical protein E2562_010559 [Oryza meyeriana var. granulata]
MLVVRRGWHDAACTLAGAIRGKAHGVALRIVFWAIANNEGAAGWCFPWTGGRTGKLPGLVRTTVWARVSAWPPDRTVADRWGPSEAAIW